MNRQMLVLLLAVSLGVGSVWSTGENAPAPAASDVYKRQMFAVLSLPITVPPVRSAM